MPRRPRAASSRRPLTQDSFGLLHRILETAWVQPYQRAQEWAAKARPNQLPPAGEWRFWLMMTGAGFGKTVAAAHCCHDYVERGLWRNFALVGATAADTRLVMIEGPTGILATADPAFMPHYTPSMRTVTWPNGAKAILYSADEPERIRGANHDGAWGDEIAAWRYAEALDLLNLRVRVGPFPRIIYTTTPKPRKFLKDLTHDPRCVVTRGRTEENAANLSDQYLASLRERYKGTRLERQELLGELVEDVEGALWSLDLISAYRVRDVPWRDGKKGERIEETTRCVVAVDPAATSSAASDETGIVGAKLGSDAHIYVVADRSGRMTPDAWGRAAVGLYNDLRADHIIAEANNGGEMVEKVIQSVNPNVPVRLVHASRGKIARAEPISALYEQGKVHHVGEFPLLEDQMTTYSGDRSDASPDRLDALVWALSDLTEPPRRAVEVTWGRG